MLNGGQLFHQDELWALTFGNGGSGFAQRALL